LEINNAIDITPQLCVPFTYFVHKSHKNVAPAGPTSAQQIPGSTEVNHEGTEEEWCSGKVCFE